jgi:transcriptional/translational regulatory protein YebC/TACO1
MAGLEAGITDVIREDDTFTVITEPGDVNAVRKALEEENIAVSSSESTMTPSVSVPIADESTAKQVLRVVEALEDCDDVQAIYTNFDIPDRILEAVA